MSHTCHMSHLTLFKDLSIMDPRLSAAFYTMVRHRHSMGVGCVWHWVHVFSTVVPSLLLSLLLI